jgi:hypothetical protein
MKRLEFELTHIYRSIKSSAWLGWQIESKRRKARIGLRTDY